MRIFLPLFLSALSIVSCSSTEEKKAAVDSAPAQQTVAPKAGAITQFSCASDPSNLYSVYLPANYDAAKKYPVIIFFDAHGNGELPINKYKSLADRWNYIFIGSNSSKNGMQMNETERIGNGLVDEAKRVFPVDAQQIFLCGFSGGARVAAAIGGERSDVKGMICNSAAPQQDLPGKLFVGLAGLGDMNYLEMRKYCGDAHDAANKNKKLLVFDGKHEWAPYSIFEDALLITQLWPENSSAHNDTTIVNAFTRNIKTQSDSIKKVSCLLASNLLYTGATTAGGELTKRSGEFDRDGCVKADEAAWKKAEEKETAMQQFLADAVLTHDTTWWQQHASEYFETKEKGAEKFMRDRLRGYVSLICYSYSNQAFHTNNLHAAEKMTKVYSIVDPTNSEWAYMRAMLYMKLNLTAYVLPNLQKAVELGFNDTARLQNDPTFTPLHSDPAFNELFQKMKP